MNVYQWLCLFAVPNLFFLFWSTIINRRQKKKDEAVAARRAEIEQQQVECTSLNYLSNYMYQVAGIPLPPYNQFLADMEKKIPAVNANGYYSVTAQGYLPLSQATEEEQQWLAQYEKLQYNSLFDKKHRNEIFFPTLHP